MHFKEIVEHLQGIEAPGILEINEPDEIVRPTDPAELKKFKIPPTARTGDPFILLEAAQVAEFARVLRDDPDLYFEILVDVSAVDPSKDGEEFWVVYQFLSLRHRHRLYLKAMIPKENPEIPTLTSVYAAANWHEREAGEMFGINFLGHPDPRNILLPDDWVGYPLRKDYEYPEEYHGISCV